ncbi:radical SAM protein [Luteibacter sp. ME-Dv--P-043b]|uniref:radical SAM protein n=1 Tax=Luteibacter sp. ME-Dv--P-043b TaxID=3040291 RepID=UPI002554C2F1|nr:radical SAM protein [Luteibacter sp. ME-Dv--P-043b]
MSSERQHVFPPPMERHYPIVDGRIRTRSLEAHIVDHCNLTCVECCSLSPLLPAWTADPETLCADLRRAARVLQPRVFKLVGGEPTLHPALVDILQAVRGTGIAPTISVTTNGLLLDRMADAFWAGVDALTISLYPRPRLSDERIRHVEAMAARFDVRLNWKPQAQFVRMTRDPASTDVAETQAIYHDCWLRERCHLLRDGIFYTCTRPAHFHTLHRGHDDFTQDGLPLHDGPSLADEIHAYLSREAPLRACFHCHGGSAVMEPHRMMGRAELDAARARFA